jgi:hypothetical protein
MGVNFRASDSPFPDGTTRVMDVVNQNAVAWKIFSANPPAANLATSTWVLDPDGYLQLAAPLSTGSLVLATYVSPGTTASSIRVQMMAKPSLDTAGCRRHRGEGPGVHRPRHQLATSLILSSKGVISPFHIRHGHLKFFSLIAVMPDLSNVGESRKKGPVSHFRLDKILKP